MTDLVFPCTHCGTWHDASVTCPTTRALGSEPEQPTDLEALSRAADEAEALALERYRDLRRAA
jgi:hypothetical protein